MTISVRDAFGNLVVTDNTTLVSLTLGGGAPGANLGNAVPTTVTNGVVSFSALTVDTTGTAYELTAADASASLPPAVSLPFNITASSSSTTIESIAPVGSQTVGQPYEVVVSVVGQTPQGLVTVSDGNGASCQFSLAGADRCALTSVIAGPVTLTASYEGDINNASSSDTAPYVIDQVTSSVAITAVAPVLEQTVNQPYTVSVTVSGFNPTGTVAVTDGEGGSCQIILPQTSCALTSSTVGPKTLTADYSGDVNNSAGSDSASYTITAVDSATTILGITPPTEQEVGLPYTVTVSVTGSSPTGTVSVDDGAGASCTFDLPDSSCSLTSTSAGPKTITASYPGMRSTIRARTRLHHRQRSGGAGLRPGAQLRNCRRPASAGAGGSRRKFSGRSGQRRQHHGDPDCHCDQSFGRHLEWHQFDSGQQWCG